MVAYASGGGMGAPWTVAGALLASGCSLTMLDPVDCADDAGCVEVFGLGATCGASGSCELAVVPSDATLSGYVERAVDLAPGNDGIGTLYVGIDLTEGYLGYNVSLNLIEP
jgi:hypothetical protein